MKFGLTSFLAFLLLLVPDRNPANAAIVILVGPALTTVTAPTGAAIQDVTLTVSMAASVGTESVLSYTIPVDLSPPVGTNPPTGFTVTSVVSRLTFPGQPSFDFDLNPSEGDLLASGGPFNFNEPVQFTTTPVALFDFTLAIDSSVVAGDYSAFVVRGALLAVNQGLTATAQIGPPAVIRVQAVPEPTVASLSIMACWMGLIHRRRKTPLDRS